MIDPIKQLSSALPVYFGGATFPNESGTLRFAETGYCTSVISEMTE